MVIVIHPHQVPFLEDLRCRILSFKELHQIFASHTCSLNSQTSHIKVTQRGNISEKINENQVIAQSDDKILRPEIRYKEKAHLKATAANYSDSNSHLCTIAFQPKLTHHTLDNLRRIIYVTISEVFVYLT